jgi:hypothetical protein
MDLTVGMRGSVNLEGLSVGGIPCSIGTNTPGVITHLTDAGVTVRLEAPFGGVDVLEVTSDRFAPRDAE